MSETTEICLTVITVTFMVCFTYLIAHSEIIIKMIVQAVEDMDLK